MRGLTSTLVLLVILAGLGGYIYFVESDTPAGDTPVKEQVFAGLAADDVEEIRIAIEDGDVSRVQKVNDEWTLLEPIEADADQNTLAAIAGSLASLEIERVLEDAGDVGAYGLDPAHLDVSFRAKGRAGEQHLLLGDKTPTGGNIYAKVAGQPRIFLINESFDTSFGRDTFALRDKQVLRIDRAKVDRVELSSDTLMAEFARSGSDWRIVRPIEARGDYGTIENVVERLATLRMQSLVAQDATDLAMYGLNEPEATIAATAGSSRATLLLGRTENGLTFAKDASRPMVFTVTSTVPSDLIKPLSEYRRKDLFDSRSFTATRVEFRRNGMVQTFEKTLDNDKQDVWRTADGTEIDAMKMEDLLSRMTALRADSFENGTIDMPVLTVQVTFSDTRMETVTFARAGSDILAARADEKGVARLGSMSFDDMVQALDALKK